MASVGLSACNSGTKAGASDGTPEPASASAPTEATDPSADEIPDDYDDDYVPVPRRRTPGTASVDGGDDPDGGNADGGEDEDEDGGAGGGASGGGASAGGTGGGGTGGGTGGGIPARTLITFEPEDAVFAGECEAAGDLVPVRGGVQLRTRSFKIALPSGARALAERAVCTLRIPAKLPVGYYIAGVRIELPYSVRRTAGTSGALAAKVTPFGANSDTLAVELPLGQSENQPRGLATQTARFAVGSASQRSQCNPNRVERGFLAVDLRLTAQKDRSDESFLSEVRTFTLREGAELLVAPCP
jgi:hypothetical protein